MKLLAQIGIDYHLNQLPHVLRHYHHLGVDGFVCTRQGSCIAEAQQILANYPVEIVAEYGAVTCDDARPLAHDESYVFMHIDHNTPLAPFTALLPPANQIVFLADRVLVTWGTLSLVEATHDRVGNDLRNSATSPPRGAGWWTATTADDR